MLPELSIFLSSKADGFNRALVALADAGVNILTFSIDHVAPYHIMRIICSEPRKAYRQLLDQSLVFERNDVFGLRLPNRPGALRMALDVLSRDGIRIEYGYQTMLPGSDDAVVILKTNGEDERAKAAFRAAGVEDIEDLTAAEAARK